MSRELFIFLVMLLCGLSLSMLFDLFRAIRKTVKLPEWTVTAGDILFWCIACFSVTACVWNAADGMVRFYEPLGLLLGCIFYFLLLQRPIFGVFLFIIKNILRFVRFILKILLTPWRFLYKILVYRIVRYYKEKNNTQEIRETENE